MGNRDAPADPRRAEVLAALQHLEQHPIRLLVQLQQRNQLLQNLVFRGALEVELDRVFTEEFSQFHRASCLVR